MGRAFLSVLRREVLTSVGGNWRPLRVGGKKESGGLWADFPRRARLGGFREGLWLVRIPTMVLTKEGGRIIRPLQHQKMVVMKNKTTPVMKGQQAMAKRSGRPSGSRWPRVVSSGRIPLPGARFNI